MKLRKRLTALFVSAVLAMSFVPVTAIGATPDGAEPSETAQSSKAASVETQSSKAASAESQSSKAASTSAKTSVKTQAASTNQLTVTFRSGYSASQGKVQYSLDDAATWIDVTSAVNNRAIVVTGDNLRLRIVPESGYSADLTPTTYREDSGSPIQLISDNAGIAGGLTSANGYQISGTVASVALEDVEFKQDDGGGSGTTNETGTFTYSFTGEAADIVIGDGGDNMTFLPQGAMSGQSAQYYYDGSGSVTLRVGVFFISKLTSIIVNGVDYSAQFPTTDAAKVSAFSEQHTWAEFKVPYAASYVISTVSADDDSPAIGNFLWSYDSKDADNDDYLDHGRLELISYAYDGQTYSASDLDPSKGGIYWNDQVKEGEAALPSGGTLSVRLVPEYGYQLTSFTINGGEFQAGEDVSTYSFEVPRGNFHLGAHFTAVADAVSSNSKAVSGGFIALGEGELTTGSAVLSVGDATVTAEQRSSFASAARGYTIASYLNIDLDQVVYKGTASDAWTTEMTELNNAATVTLQLADDLDGSDAVVVHEKHDGTYEAIDATYDSAAKTVSFETDGFSNYALASKSSSKTGSSDKSTLAKTGDPLNAMPVAIVGVAALVLAVFSLRKLRRE